MPAKIYIALLRGINVGGNNPLPMKALAAMLETLGARQVQTYIQSGNAVFQSAVKNPLQLSKRFSAEIKKQHGFEPQVLVLELDTVKQAAAENPFPEAEINPATLHIGFLATPATDPDLAKLMSLKTVSERFHLNDRALYLHTPEGLGNSKLATRAEKHIGVAMTIRNWRTLSKIIEMADAQLAGIA